MLIVRINITSFIIIAIGIVIILIPIITIRGIFPRLYDFHNDPHYRRCYYDQHSSSLSASYVTPYTMFLLFTILGKKIVNEVAITQQSNYRDIAAITASFVITSGERGGEIRSVAR